ncbi:MAG TPA: EAL domain-containing protein [Candidatus Obscuribacterales bacterium]
MFAQLRWSKTIRAQLMCGFGAILLVSCVSSAIGYSSLQRLRHSSQTTLDQATQIRELSLELQSNFLRARQAEEAYLTHWKSLSAEDLEQAAATNRRHLASVRHNLARLQALAREQAPLLEELALLESLFLNYEAAFAATVTRIETESAGELQQRLRRIGQPLTAEIQQLDQPDIQLMVWMIAAKEQAYFNTGNPQYLNDMRADLDRLTYLLQGATVEPPQPAVQALAQDYLASLHQALLLDQQVRVNAIVANNINQEIDQIIQTIGALSAARSQAARLNLAKTADQSSIALLATALTALGLTVWASLWLGRRLMQPITALHQAAERIGAGDLSYTLHLPGHNEFSVVADTFNQMVGQLRHTLADLEQRVAERTQALAAANDSLQDRTRSLEGVLQQLRDSETKYRTLLEQLQAGVIVHGADTRIVMCNQMARAILGDYADHIMGGPLTEATWPLVDEAGTPLPLALYPVNQVIAQQQPLHNYVMGLRLPTEERCLWVLVSAFPTFDDQGVLQQVVVTFTDITDRKLAEEKLRHRALHDALTGLPNRTLLIERLDQALRRGRRHPDSQFAVLFIDLNRFKVINDSLGHTVGDQLLVVVAHTLLGHVRTIDTVARLGGDEFVILLEEVTHEAAVMQVVDRIQADFKTPIQLLGHTVYTSASIGIAFGKADYQSGQDILRDADNAMYRAKAKGKASYEIFDPGMHQSAIALLELETSLQKALTNQEFRLQYQPIIGLASRQLIGFEALVRWLHPERGLIMPSEFIPLAEETGLIIPLSEWILQAACGQMMHWGGQMVAAKALKINVNIAAGLFQDEHFVPKLDQILRETQLSPRNLGLEVTESVLLKNVDEVLSTLAQLRSRQIEVSLDDFGTGYSSLSYLKQFSINALKIDKSFVDSLQQDGDSSIVEAIIQIAQSLEMTVVAEGVETVAQQAWLKQLGCSALQGYLIAPPLWADEAEAFMKTSRFCGFMVPLGVPEWPPRP